MALMQEPRYAHLFGVWVHIDAAPKRRARGRREMQGPAKSWKAMGCFHLDAGELHLGSRTVRRCELMFSGRCRLHSPMQCEAHAMHVQGEPPR